MDDTTDATNERTAHDSLQASLEAVIMELQAKQPSLTLYSIVSETAGEFYVHRRAGEAERRLYRKLLADDKRLDAQDSLMGCVLYPDQAEFKKRRADAPFIVETICDGILAASGIYLDVVRKKH